MHQAETLEKIMAGSTKNKKQPHPASIDPHPRVISVSSGKGGVGKTNIVTNLAYCLAKMGKKTLILDADLNLANVDVLLGIAPEFNIHHVLLGEKSLSEIVVEGPGGMMILPASSGIMELGDLSEEQKLYFLSEITEFGKSIDLLLIDTAAGLNNNVIYFTLAAQERIIVLTPEPTSLTDAYAMIKVLSSRHDVKKFRILVNAARSEKEARGVYRQITLVADRFLDTLSLDYLGYIPHDSKLPQAVRAQRLVSEFAPDSAISRQFKQLADQVCHEESTQHLDGNIQFFWQGMFNL
jgi:flagellar biosynthesis protein FlhG